MRPVEGNRHIAIVCDTVPYPVRSGDNKRIGEMIHVLRGQGWIVHLVLTALVDGTSRKLCRRHVDALHIYHGRGLRTRFRNLLRLAVRRFDRIGSSLGCLPLEDLAARILGRCIVSRVEDYWQRYPTGLDHFLGKLCKRHGWKALIVEYIWLHRAIDKLPKGPIRILDTHDVQYKRVEEYASVGFRFPLKITRAEEAHILNRFDAAIAIQSQEATSIREMCPTLRVLIVGTSSSAHEYRANNPIVGRILYVGGYNGANIDGLRCFLTRCWPSILELCPNVQLYVYGYIYRAFLSEKFQNVKFLGHVNDIENEYAKATLVINPIRIGTGLKIKTVEALACRKPLVTTMKGVEGLNSECKKACVVSTDEKDFVENVVRLLDNVEARESLITAADAFARTHLSTPAVYKDLLNFLSELP